MDQANSTANHYMVEAMTYVTGCMKDAVERKEIGAGMTLAQRMDVAVRMAAIAAADFQTSAYCDGMDELANAVNAVAEALEK
jgi:hypothetical protein